MLQFSFYEKNLRFNRNLLCFVGSNLDRSCLVFVAYNKTNTSCLLCLILKLFTLGNVIFNSASRRWLLITSSEWYLILNKMYGIFPYYEPEYFTKISMMFSFFISVTTDPEALVQRSSAKNAGLQLY